MAESLYRAEKMAREELQIRANLARQRKVEDHKRQEEEVKDLAKQARENALKAGTNRTRQEEDEDDKKYREEVMRDNRREVERQFRLDRAGKRRKPELLPFDLTIFRNSLHETQNL